MYQKSSFQNLASAVAPAGFEKLESSASLVEAVNQRRQSETLVCARRTQLE